MCVSFPLQNVMISILEVIVICHVTVLMVTCAPKILDSVKVAVPQDILEKAVRMVIIYSSFLLDKFAHT